MSNNDNKTNVIIDFGKQYTFGEMMDKLSKDSTLSFINEGVLYFKRQDKLLTTWYKNNMIYDVVHAIPMQLSNEIINKKFYETNIYISSIIYEIELSDIKQSLLDNKIVMLNLNDRTWVLEMEDNVVYLDYSEAKDANEDNYLELFATDVLTSLLEGQWYIIDGEEV